MEAIKKIVIIGPESTGKSTLCSLLAEHYKTSWVPEYAREYLLENGIGYSYDDLLKIAKGQIALEEAAECKLSGIGDLLPGTIHPTSHIVHHPSSPLLFIDTDMQVMKVWCEYVFNNCHGWILNRIAERKYDGYLLCNPDLDWVADDLREYPDNVIREKLYCYYKDIVINQPVPCIDITGNYNERLQKAINFIDEKIR
ncbi:MAG: ATP-binding protein [Bacteroidota bacterium]|nr:ATP-binding protein [Bacteroidota bacterium]